MRIILRTAVTLATASLVVGVAAPAAVAGGQPDPTRPTNGPCAYTPTPDDPAVRPVGLPPDPRRTPDRGYVRVMLHTNRGDIPVVLDRAKAPCTVQSFLHLTQRDFYDRTTCHRLTTYDTLSVLQCGDPSGTGEGGPGYKYKDELDAAADLPPWPDRPDRVNYTRGLLAMANAGPDTNGSQFFLVYKDSRLAPAYTVFGYVEPRGLATLDRVAAGGVDPAAEGAPLDGPPALKTDIRKAQRCIFWFIC